MSDPRHEAGSPDFSALEGQAGEWQQAWDAVRAVVTWYTAQIAQEHRAPVPDEDRIEQLMTDRQTVLDDQRRLEEADPQEVARIGAVYAARLKELLGS